MSDELAKAEQAWRWRAEHPSGLGLSTRQKVQLRMLLEDYDRRGEAKARLRELVVELDEESAIARLLEMRSRVQAAAVEESEQ